MVLIYILYIHVLIYILYIHVCVCVKIQNIIEKCTSEIHTINGKNLILFQDFALDPEEVRMRAAARHMVCNMTAGMALITCREPLLATITSHLKTNFTAHVRVRIKIFFILVLESFSFQVKLPKFTCVPELV